MPVEDTYLLRMIEGISHPLVLLETDLEQVSGCLSHSPVQIFHLQPCVSHLGHLFSLLIQARIFLGKLNPPSREARPRRW